MSPDLESLSGSVDSFEARYIERARESLQGTEPATIAAVSVHREPGPPPDGVVLAGWWCDPGSVPPGVHVLPNPWDDRDAIELLDRYCWELGRSVAADLGRSLNEVNPQKRSPIYWEALLMPWLLYAVSTVVDRRLFVVTASALAPDAPWEGRAELPVPDSLLEAVASYASDDGNASLLSRIATLEGRTLRAAPDTSPFGGGSRPQLRHRRSRPTLARLREVLASLASHTVRVGLRVIPGRQLVMAGGARFSASQLLSLAVRAPGVTVRPTLPYLAARARPERAQPGADRGTLEGAIGPGDRRTRTFAALLPSLLPATFREGHGEIARASARRYGPPAPTVVGNYSFDEIENEFIARGRAAGVRLAFVQHGGAYLQLKTHPMGRLESPSDSLFLSWGAGWEQPGARTTPDPRLARLRDSHQGGDRVVLVEWVTPPLPYPLYFASTPLANQGYGIGERLGEMVGALSLDRGRLALKRFPTAVDPEERPQALEALSTQGPSGSGSAVEWMRRARMTVIPYPDTPFIEAMVIGVPTIGLWNPSLWEMRVDASPYFERLAEIGVVYSDPVAAAAKVDEVYEDAKGWWGQDEIQEARQVFLERFARGPDWRSPWVQVLREMRRAR